MLLHDAGLSYLHFVFAFIMVGALVAEAFVLRLPVDGRVARLLLRIDLFYGVSALLLILAGIARVVWGAKGWSYYEAEPFFWAKMAAFALVGLISIAPTRTYIRWVKAAGANVAFAVPEVETKRVRRLVVLETHLIALLLVFAVLMARGVGQGWPR
jgi:putative membrane protein